MERERRGKMNKNEKKAGGEKIMGVCMAEVKIRRCGKTRSESGKNKFYKTRN